MKKLFVFIILIHWATEIVAQSTCSCLTPPSGFVSLKGKRFYDGNGDPFFLKMVNYSVSITYNVPNPSLPGDFDIHPHAHYGSTTHFENMDGPQSILRDFMEIKNQGFNAIRLIMGIRKRNTWPIQTSPNSYVHPCELLYPNARVFALDWFIPSPPNNNPDNKCFCIEPPYSFTGNLEVFLLKIEQVLNLAETAGLKVLLLTGDNYDLFPNLDEQPQSFANVDDYSNYLSVLCSYFKCNTTLFAYDLCNEPDHKDGDNHHWGRKKEQVCAITEQLYDAIKAVDCNHLITMGGGNVLNWDFSVMKIDFACVHFYIDPDFRYEFNIPNRRRSVVENGKKRLMDQLYWHAKFTERPLVLEEVGFPSFEPFNENLHWFQLGVQGNYNDLQDFIHELIPYVHDLEYAGIGWWTFQDYASSLDNTLTAPNPLSHEAKAIREYFYGLLKTGDPGPQGYSSLRKISVPTEFETHDWLSPLTNPPVRPSTTYNANETYYDPYQNHTLNSNASTYASGYVLDGNNRPVEGVELLGISYLKTEVDIVSGEDLNKGYWIKTYSDRNGYFKFIPFNSQLTFSLIHKITFIKCTGSGIGSYQEFGIWNSANAITGNVYFAPLNQFLTFFSLNKTINNTSFQNVFAWNDINLNGLNSGNLNATSRYSIRLTPPFLSSQGSIAHIYTSDVFNDCNNFNGFRQQNNMLSNNYEIRKNITLYFVNNQEKSIRILPNPSNNSFRLSFNFHITDNSATLIIVDFIGRIIHQELLHDNIYLIDFLDPGIYTVIVENKNQILSSKIIKL